MLKIPFSIFSYGQADSQALRGHFLIDAAFNYLLALQALGADGKNCNDNSVTIPELQEAGPLSNALLTGTVTPEDVAYSEILHTID